jgi:hypothetical protein
MAEGKNTITVCGIHKINAVFPPEKTKSTFYRS